MIISIFELNILMMQDRLQSQKWKKTAKIFFSNSSLLDSKLLILVSESKILVDHRNKLLTKNPNHSLIPPLFYGSISMTAKRIVRYRCKLCRVTYMYATDSQTSAISRHGKKIMTKSGKSFTVNGLSKICENKTGSLAPLIY